MLEVWTGPQAATPLARGGEPSLGRSLNKPWVWLPLAALFLLPFVDPRRLLRLVHLDLLVLLGFGISQLYFNQGRIEVSVPLVYPLLAYLLVRALLAGLRPRPRREALVPWLPMRWLAIGLVLLVAFRVGLNVQDSTVIDVGYASTVGADRIAHGEGSTCRTRCTATPTGRSTTSPTCRSRRCCPGTAAGAPCRPHAAAVAFDLLTIIGLMLLGSTLQAGAAGRRLGLALAFAWAAYPFSLLVLQENTNDGLVAALLVFALVALRSPPGRGALLALAAAAKFVPLALARCWPRGRARRRSRSWLAFTLAFCAVAWPPCCPSCPTAACVSCTTRRSASSSGAAPRSASGRSTRRSTGSSRCSRRVPPRWPSRCVRTAPARAASGRGARGGGDRRGAAAGAELVLLLPGLDRAALPGELLRLLRRRSHSGVRGSTWTFGLGQLGLRLKGAHRRVDLSGQEARAR